MWFAQLYAFRYGTIPVVRATGGLVDTVVDVNDQTISDGTASGFVFEDFQIASSKTPFIVLFLPTRMKSFGEIWCVV